MSARVATPEERADAERLVAAVIDEAVQGRALVGGKWRELAALEPLCQAAPYVRVAALVHSVERLAAEFADMRGRPYYLVSVRRSWGGGTPLSWAWFKWHAHCTWISVRQRLFKKRYSLDRMVVNLPGRYETLVRLLCFRLPPLAVEDLERLLVPITQDNAYVMQWRHLYRIAGEVLRSQAPSEAIRSAVDRRYIELDASLGTLPTPAGDQVHDRINAILGYRPEDLGTMELDAADVPESFRALTPFADYFGIYDDDERGKRQHFATGAERALLLAEVGPHKAAIEAWVEDYDVYSDDLEDHAKLAFQNLLDVVDSLEWEQRRAGIQARAQSEEGD